MDPTLVYQFIILIILLIVSAFFSGSETTFTSCSPSKFYKLRKTKRIQRLLKLFDNKENLISLILFGNNAVNIFASSLAAVISLKYAQNHPLFGEYALEISATIMTFSILIFSEVLPKTIAIRNPERIVFLISDIYYFLLKIFFPIVWFINLLIRLTLKAVGMHESKQYEVMTAKDTLRSEIEFYHSKGSFIQRDKEMLGGVLDLSEIKIHAVITHRKDVDMVDLAHLTLEEIEKKYIDSSHTRMPVYSEDSDKIMGILHFRDFFTLKTVKPSYNLDDIKSILLKPQYVSSETTLLTQLTEFKRTKNHMAIVVDEYGSMIGIVTLEDIVEEIVGDIEDEHDDEEEEERDIQEQSEGVFLVNGSVLIRDFTRKTKISFNSIDGFSTIAGLIIHKVHRIPKKGESVTVGDMTFEVVEATSHKIKKVKITMNSTSSHDENN